MKLVFNPFTGQFDFTENQAGQIAIRDERNYFVSKTVEGALQEIAEGRFNFLNLPHYDLRYLRDAPADGNTYGRKNNAWEAVGAGGGGTWGSITGTLSDQTDLNTALNARLIAASNLSDLANAGTARTNLGLIAGGAGDIWVEKAGDTMTGQLLVDLGSDVIGLRIQGNASQTANLQTWENSGGTVLYSIKSNGFVKQDVTKNNPTTLEEMHYQIIKLTGTGDYLTLQPFSFAVEANFNTTWNTIFRGIVFKASAQATNSPYSKFSEFTGAHFQAGAGKANTYTTVKGGYFEAWNGSGATITTSIAGDFQNYTDTSTTTVTTAIGLRVSFGKANTPTMTTAYGIKVEDVTVSTTNYAIYTGAGDIRLMSSSSNKLGFHGATPVAKQTVTGSRGGNAALADLLTKLANLGLIVDSTSA